VSDGSLSAKTAAALVLLASVCFADPAAALYETSATPAPANRIDRPVLQKLAEKGIQPAATCSDSTFVRRVYLDTTGTIPTADEARAFIGDRTPEKRAKLIDTLLADDAFADYCAMQWCDRLRVKSEFPINLWPNAVQAYYRWIHTSIRENKRYDQFVREILIANGSNFRVPQVNFFRALQDSEPGTIAQAAALAFMGVRTDRWPERKQADLAAFFSDIRFKRTGEWKEEIVYADLFDQSPADRRPETLAFPDGTETDVPHDVDARSAFADWLIRPANPWFARNAVNRIWHQLLGRGIIHEPDDIRPDNPPSNSELLALLEREFVESGYDTRHIYRLILTSATYQRSALPAADTPEAGHLFAHYPLRRTDAETLIDTLCKITGTVEEYWSVIPEPFTFIPTEQSAITLADGSITSSFLEQFGRPPRDTGFAAERNNQITPTQKLHLLNSSHVLKKLESVPRNLPNRSRGNPIANVQELYLAILSRYPTPGEMGIIRSYARNAEARGPQVAVDISWALINSPEFLYKH
jgi:hypothetical protein